MWICGAGESQESAPKGLSDLLTELSGVQTVYYRLEYALRRLDNQNVAMESPGCIGAHVRTCGEGGLKNTCSSAEAREAGSIGHTPIPACGDSQHRHVPQLQSARVRRKV